MRKIIQNKINISYHHNTETTTETTTEAVTDNLRYVDDGCHSEGSDNQDDVVGFYQSEYSEAFVRCCSIGGESCDTFSNCQDASQLVNYASAVSTCEANGRRLCTKDELLTDICCGTGWQCDHYGVWTSTLYSGIFLD